MSTYTYNVQLGGIELEYVGCYNLDWMNSLVSDYYRTRPSYHDALLDCATDSYCLSKNTTYLSLRYGTCLCSETAPDADGKVGEDACDHYCPFDQGLTCGGEDASSIYKASGEYRLIHNHNAILKLTCTRTICHA